MTEIDIRPTPSSELARLDLSAEFLESYPVLNPETQAVLVQSLEEDGLELSVSSFTRIKVPTGAMTQWAVPNDTGDSDYVKELVGIVVEIAPRRSFWVDPDPSGKPPDCRSVDLKIGDGMYGVGSDLHPSGSCETCPMNQRGSGGKDGSQASACKEQRLLFFATATELLPLMVSVPPGSLKPLSAYRTNLLKRGGRRLQDVETRLTLIAEESATGIAYAQIKFARTERTFTADELVVIRAYGAMIKDLVKAQPDLVDAAANEAATYTGTPAEDVPFDPEGLPVDEVPAAKADTGKGSSGK